MSALIATLIAPDALSREAIAAACDAVKGEAGAIVDGVAVDIACAGDAQTVRAVLEAAVPGVDVVVQRADLPRRKSLLIADMDSTMITVECIDELADYAGIKPQIAAITERAMRGELDFRAALDERVACLAGLSESVIAQCLAERVEIMPGAKTLIRTMVALGAHTVLVSGGFTRFAEPVAGEIGFATAIANTLEIADGALTGRVLEPIIDSSAKLATLNAQCAALGIAPDAVVAVGDGANDIAMLEAAGLGMAYHAHPKAVAAADSAVRYGDLTVLLRAQGIPENEWVRG